MGGQGRQRDGRLSLLGPVDPVAGESCSSRRSTPWQPVNATIPHAQDRAATLAAIGPPVHRVGASLAGGAPILQG